MQTKIINYTRRFRYNEPLKNINKIEKYKKLNMVEHKTDINSMTEHKTDMNNTKIEKYKKVNMMKHKTDINITKIGKDKKTEQNLYRGIQN